MNDPCTPVRTAYALALASVLANSVISSQAGRDLAAQVHSQSRMLRLRHADDDSSTPPGLSGDDPSKLKPAKTISRGRSGDGTRV
jgi:hypothetical protein